MDYGRDVDLGFPSSAFTWRRIRTKFVSTHVSAAGVAESTNLFRISGAVKVYNLYGKFVDCTDVSAVTVAHIDLYDDSSKAITKATGTDLSGITVGSLIGRNAAATTALYLADAADGIVADGDLGSDFFAAFLAMAQGDTDTFIRFNFTSDGGGYNFKINWEVTWIPLFDDSYISPTG